VTREAEVHEPLPVDRLRHFFQDLDAPVVVFDQIIKGCKDTRYPVLFINWWKGNLEISERHRSVLLILF
jgi:hypothetical protein